MGLGKTIQVLAPASLLANWAAEIARFASGLKALIAHPSALPSSDLKTLAAERISDIDLVITSYGSLLRLPWITERSWCLVILDEAQAIKNPDARQTRIAKRLQARVRVALTGTPIENRLGDLWSILDFINPGLLRSAKEFTGFAEIAEVIRAKQEKRPRLSLARRDGCKKTTGAGAPLSGRRNRALLRALPQSRRRGTQPQVAPTPNSKRSRITPGQCSPSAPALPLTMPVTILSLNSHGSGR
jgi:hypothetical protein